MALLIFEHSDRTGVERLGRTLRSYGHRLRFVHLHRGDSMPVDLDDVDGIISCGGPQAANDDELPWLESQMAMMRKAHEREMPIVGLCLGSQILARALGGEVAPMKDGPEIGWQELRLTPVGREDPLYAGSPWTSIQAHFHHDEVTELPPDARLLAGSDRCKVQAWTAGMRTYGFQYHPELDRGSMDTLAADEPDAVRKAGLTIEGLRAQTEQYFPAFERLTNRLFENIALLLMPVERRYTGLVKDLHH